MWYSGQSYLVIYRATLILGRIWVRDYDKRVNGVGRSSSAVMIRSGAKVGVFVCKTTENLSRFYFEWIHLKVIAKVWCFRCDGKNPATWATASRKTAPTIAVFVIFGSSDANDERMRKFIATFEADDVWMKMFCFVDTKLNTFDYLEERIGPYRRLQKIVTNLRIEEGLGRGCSHANLKTWSMAWHLQLVTMIASLKLVERKKISLVLTIRLHLVENQSS